MKRRILTSFVAMVVILTVILTGCTGGGAVQTPSGTQQPGGTGTSAPPPVAQGETLEWKWNAYHSASDPLIDADYYVVKKIEELTGGRFKIKVFPSGQLTAAGECLNSISSGAFPIGSGTFIPGNRDLAFSSFGFYFTAPDFINWFYNGGGTQLMDKIYAELFKVKYFPTNVLSADAGFRANKAIKTFDDFKGMKVRAGAIETQDILKGFGSSSMFIAGSEIYEAMQRGTIDAFEFVTPSVDWKLGFQEIAKFWVYPAWYQTFTAYGMTVNLDAWNKLAPDFKAAVTAATQMSIIRQQGRTELEAADYTQKFIDYGTQLSRVDEKFLTDMRPVVKTTIEATCSKTKYAAATYASQFAYLKRINVWKRMSDPWTYGMILDDADYPVIKPEWLPDWYKDFKYTPE